jgi:hypothetical protein
MDVTAIEHAYQEVTRFISGASNPSARCLAIADFLVSLPSDLMGRAYFEDDLMPRFLELLDIPDVQFYDPEHTDVLQRLYAMMVAGKTAPREHTDRIAGAIARFGVRQQVPLPTPSPYSAIVSIPVALSIPTLGHQSSPASYFGSILNVTVTPRSLRPPADSPVKWMFDEGGLRLAAPVRGAFHAAEAALLRLQPLTSSFVASEPIGFDLSTLRDDMLPLLGNAAQLGLAAAIAGALLSRVSASSALRPTSKYGWVGTMTPQGMVLSHSPDTLRAKVRAASFAGLSGMVVSEDTVAKARTMVPSQKSPFEILGIASLEEALSHTQLFEQLPFAPEAIRSARSPRRPHQVFLSYAREDASRAVQLYERLTKAGYTVWMDKKTLLPGEDWKYEVRRAIQESQCVLICLSRSSVSKRGYIQKEMRFAIEVSEELPEGRVFIIPVRLDACDVPLRLRDRQYHDLWSDDSYQRLFLGINKAIEGEAD